MTTLDAFLIDCGLADGCLVEDAVIRSERGGTRRLCPGSIVNWFRQLYRGLGLTGCSSHSGDGLSSPTRRGLVFEAGGSLRDVQQLAGRQSIAQTQAYIDSSARAKRRRCFTSIARSESVGLASTRARGRSRMTKRRFWIYFLLFLFNMIAYTDRVNISVAGKPIADELGLSPVALGYLFSSFLWAYVLMMLPGGRLIDRFGPHNIAALATAVWSVAQMLTGAAINFSTMLLTRLGLGIGEAPFAPVTYRSVGLWGPITERGTAIAAISAGSSLGAAVGAPFVAWIISVSSWRWSFVVTGAFGLVWVVIWRSLVSTPEKTSWLPEAERQRILAERGGGLKTPDHDGVGYLGLIRTPAMWGLFISQGCLVYTVYLYLSWLPNYLQTARHLSVMGSGVYTAIPFVIASGANIAANWIFDKAMSIDAVHSGKRRYLVAICLAMTASGILIPFVESLPLIIILVTVAVSFSNIGPAANGALTNDLLRSPADAGRALAFLVLGGNTFGLCAPIITGYLVEATGSFDSAFIAAGVLALIGATAALVLSRGTIGELPVRRLTQPGLAG